MLARRIFVAVMMSIALAWLLVSNDYVGEVVGEYLVRDDLQIMVDLGKLGQSPPPSLLQSVYRQKSKLLGHTMLQYAFYLLTFLFHLLPHPRPPMLAILHLGLWLASMIIVNMLLEENTELTKQMIAILTMGFIGALACLILPEVEVMATDMFEWMIKEFLVLSARCGAFVSQYVPVPAPAPLHPILYVIHLALGFYLLVSGSPQGRVRSCVFWLTVVVYVAGLLYCGWGEFFGEWHDLETPREA